MKKGIKSKVPVVFLVIIISGIVVSLLAIILKFFYPVKDIHQDFPKLGVSLIISAPGNSGDFLSDPGSLPSTKIVNGKIVYYNGGSSSCPPIVKKGFLDKDNVATLEIASYSGRMCTADYRMFSQEISRSDGKDIPTETVIKIIK